MIVPCTADRLANPATVPAPPLYGIWIYDQDRNTQIPVVPPEEGVMIINDVVTDAAAQLPPVILDKVSGVDLDSTLVGEGVGILQHPQRVRRRRRGYGTGWHHDREEPRGNDCRPATGPFPAHRRRVSMPDDEVLDFRNTAFGTVNFMREILGYVPVQPGRFGARQGARERRTGHFDPGSQRAAIGPRHSNWLQGAPGEVLECNGCHDPQSTRFAWSRETCSPPSTQGAPTTGSPSRIPDPALFADMGETMAQTLSRSSCATDSCRARLTGVST